MSFEYDSAARTKLVVERPVFFVIALAWVSVLGGPLKYIGKGIGVPIYLIPKALLLLLILRQVFFLRATPYQLLIILSICFMSYIGFTHNVIAPQILFGIWALVPFFFGLCFPSMVLSQKVIKSFYMLLAVAALGEVASYFTNFPWSGMTVEFGGVTTTASREWSSGSARRLAGFSTSSIELSTVLGVIGIFLVIRGSHFLSRCAMLLIISSLLYITTMKTALFAFAFACLPVLAPSRFFKALSGFTALTFVILGAVIPFILQSNIPIISTLIGQASKFETLALRFQLTWPGVLVYLDNLNAGLWGAGIGSLGAAISVAKAPMDFASVDNVYLYIIGEGGLLGVLILLVFVRKLASSAFLKNGAHERYALPLLVFFAIYGFTQPLIESNMIAVYFGALLSSIVEPKVRLFRRRITPPIPCRPEIDFQSERILSNESDRPNI